MNQPPQKKAFLHRINFNSLITACFGIAIGSILTFYWNDLSQFYTDKVGFAILGIAVLVALFVASKLLNHYLRQDNDKTLGKLKKQAEVAISDPKQIPHLIEIGKDYVQPFLSIWTLSRILGLVVGVVVTILGGIIAIQANKLIDNQNKIVTNQNKLFETQNGYIAKELDKILQQTELLTEQTELFRQQNINVEKQTDLLGKQNRLFIEQNGLVRIQNSRVDSQIVLMGVQNDRINIQNNLIEADRRSSLVFLMSNVLDKVDEEIRTIQKRKGLDTLEVIPDSIRYRLSDPLIGRIVALSRAFKPYKQLTTDSLGSKAMSPERGQLFIALMESALDSFTQNSIVQRGDFSYAAIGYVKLKRAFLRGANFRSADLSSANFSQADLSSANFSQANLSSVNFSQANLSAANFYQADLYETNLQGVVLNYAIFHEVQGVNTEQLIGGLVIELNDDHLVEKQYYEGRVKSLYHINGLNPEIKSFIEKEKPCLFYFKGCE